MKPYHLWLGAVAVSLGSNAIACIQGYHVPPRKPLIVPNQVDTSIAALRFEQPKFELSVAGGLMPSAKPEIMVPQLELPRVGFAATPAGITTMTESKADYERIVREFELRPKGIIASFEDTTDYAVALIYLGRQAQAVGILLSLEELRPGVYSTAANLGTAYELTGNLQMAAKWIGEGIARDSKSHDGTEWLHLAILRAKIKLQSDKEWLKGHSVLDVADDRKAPEIVRAIEYQLNERLNFVQPTDGVVCDLFYQAARLMDGENDKERRAHYLRESLRFGDWRKAEAAKLIKG